MQLSSLYLQQVLQHQNLYNSAQFELAQELSTLQHKLQNNLPVKQGVYIQGSVGTGKSMLMDLFGENLKNITHKRVHFHRFMHELHSKLYEYTNIKQKNPLQTYIKEFTSHIKVLCFDEFFIDNIADASILIDILIALHKAEVVVIITSNTLPCDLYPDGLQRDRFLHIFNHKLYQLFNVFELKITSDYRSLHNKSKYRGRIFEKQKNNELLAREYHYLLNTLNLKDSNDKFVNIEGTQLQFYGKSLSSSSSSNGILIGSFDNFCGKTKGRLTYLQLIKKFNYFLIYDIPNLSEEQSDMLKRFIVFIDIVYDNQINLYLSFTNNLENFYNHNNELTKLFERTISRITEVCLPDNI